jgi:hypothetical protein
LHDLLDGSVTRPHEGLPEQRIEPGGWPQVNESKQPNMLGSGATPLFPGCFVANVESGQQRIDLVEFVDPASAIGIDPRETIRRLKSISSKP